jgi:septal ring factor EnvC (AmiA/AmiB activator)
MKTSRILAITAMLAFSMGLAAPLSYAADGQSDRAKELARIKREMREKKKELTRAGRRERSILAELENIDREIQAGSEELADQQGRLQEAETVLREIERSSAELGRELAKQKTFYGIRLRALYKMSRSELAVYAPDGLGSLAKRVKYLGLIAERDRELIRDYGVALDRFALQEAGIAEKKADILERRRTIEGRKAELETARQRKSALLANVRRTKTVYVETLQELEAASAGLWALIKKEEQERRSATEAGGPAAGGGPAGKNMMLWPLEGPVLTRFGMQRHPQFGTMVFRRGIEIEAREGQEVRAAHGGQAAYADWYKGHGKLVILDHGKGLYTLYGNLSKLGLGKGERVSKGQVIGLAGETGSLRGSKLYFEIRRNGEAQDPIGWLAKQ